MTKKYMILLAMLALIGGVGCSKKSAAKVSQKLAEVAHDPSQCPQIADGYYNNGGVTPPQFIEIYFDRAGGHYDVNLNGYEQVPIIGKNTPQKNTASVSGACIGNSIHIVGRDPSGNPTAVTITPTADGGLNADQVSPKGPTVHYESAGPLKSTADQIKKWFTVEDSGSGLPQNNN